MFGLITNETCSTIKNVHIRRNRDRNVFILSMTEITSRDSFNHAQETKKKQNVLNISADSGEKARHETGFDK